MPGVGGHLLAASMTARPGAAWHCQLRGRSRLKDRVGDRESWGSCSLPAYPPTGGNSAPSCTIASATLSSLLAGGLASNSNVTADVVG